MRTPGNFFRVDPDTGRTTSKPLRQTNEYVHPSARSRIVLGGPGIQDRGKYEGKALRQYKLKFESSEPEGKQPLPVWVPRSRRKGLGRLPESPLWEIEKALVRTDPDTYEFLMERPRAARTDLDTHEPVPERSRPPSRRDI